VECIGKGTARAPYEFGCKAAITTTNCRAKGGMFILHADALHCNPFDGHTLDEALKQTVELKCSSAVEPVTVHMKADHRMSKNHLKGRSGDRFNVKMAAIGFNFRRSLKWLMALVLWLIVSMWENTVGSLKIVFFNRRLLICTQVMGAVLSKQRTPE
jgi:transposase, IS5 family